MDHRCLYGHRVPASFTFAIQSRSCPTCGAPTVSLVGYQAARRLATEGGLEAVAAFHAVRILETEFTLVPVGTATTPKVAAAARPALADEDEPVRPAGAALGATATHTPEEEEVVVDEEVDPSSAVVATPDAVALVASPADDVSALDAAAAPEPRVKPVTRVSKPKDDKKPEASGRAFEPGEEDFFKGA